MRIIRRRGWEIAESQVTPETAVIGRRALLGGTAALLAAAPALVRAAPNPKYDAGRELTDEKYSTTYNNYYEFSESKNLWKEAQGMVKHLLQVSWGWISRRTTPRGAMSCRRIR